MESHASIVDQVRNEDFTLVVPQARVEDPTCMVNLDFVEDSALDVRVVHPTPFAPI